MTDARRRSAADAGADARAGSRLVARARVLARALAAPLVRAVVVVLVATTASFALLHAAPGDPLTAIAGERALDPAARAALRARFALDAPLPAQYAAHLARVARGDLGTSFVQSRPVRAVLADALPTTLLLTSTALALALLGGVAVGTAQGWYPRGRAARRVADGFGTLLSATYAIPEFVLAAALLAVVAVRLRLLPVGGVEDPLLALTGGPGARALDRLRHLVLPAGTLALGWAAALARQQRVAVREVRGEDWIRTARAKGLADGRVLARHALRPALAQTLHTVGLLLPALVGGAVVVEAVFAWPGMGLLLLQAATARDYPLVTGAVIVVSAAVALATLATAAVQAALDPRLRTDAGALDDG